MGTMLANLNWHSNCNLITYLLVHIQCNQSTKTGKITCFTNSIKNQLKQPARPIILTNMNWHCNCNFITYLRVYIQCSQSKKTHMFHTLNQKSTGDCV